MSQRKKLKVILSNETATVVAELARAEETNATPDPEVRTVGKRREFSTAYTLAMLGEPDRVSVPSFVAPPPR